MAAHLQHQGATAVSSPSWQSAGPPTAPVGDAAGGSGRAITVASSVVVFVIISIGILSLQYRFDAWDRERESHGAARPRRRRRRGDDGAAGSNGGGVWTRGVDLEVLRALPVTVYRAAAPPGSKEDAVECSVCLAELQDGEEARFLPRCGHGFHTECVDMWLASHISCPLCRLTVSKPDPESSQTPTLASALRRPLPPEPANPPRSVLLGVSDQAAVTAANMTTGDGADTTASASTAAAALVIEIPELGPVPTTPTPRDAAKSSPVSARPRSFRRLWSFGRQGPSSSSSCTCVAAAEAPLPSEATASAAQGSAV